MESLISIFTSIRPVLRIVLLIVLGIILLRTENIFTNNEISLFNGEIKLQQEIVGWILIIWSLIILFLLIRKLLKEDFSKLIKGFYESSISYDELGAKKSIELIGNHPNDWETEKIICPLRTPVEWRVANNRLMEMVDEMIDPDTKLYSNQKHLKTSIGLYIKSAKATKVVQKYAISGFGYVVDESPIKKGNYSKYISFVSIDKRYTTNRLIFTSPFNLASFLIFGKKIILTCEQQTTAKAGDENSVLRFYLYFKVRLSFGSGFWIDGPGLVYLDDGEYKVVNGYTTDNRIS